MDPTIAFLPSIRSSAIFSDENAILDLLRPSIAFNGSAKILPYQKTEGEMETETEIMPVFGVSKKSLKGDSVPSIRINPALAEIFTEKSETAGGKLTKKNILSLSSLIAANLDFSSLLFPKKSVTLKETWNITLQSLISLKIV